MVKGGNFKKRNLADKLGIKSVYINTNFVIKEHYSCHVTCVGDKVLISMNLKCQRLHYIPWYIIIHIVKR